MKLRYINHFSTSKKFLLIAAIISIGLITLIATRAATPTASIDPENGTRTVNVGISNASGASGTAIRFGTAQTASCGKTVANYTYQVPFGNAVWNQPICNLPRHPHSAEYASRFWEWSHVNDGSSAGDIDNGKIDNDPGFPDPTRINPLENLFTREVYYASNSTTEKRIGTVSYYSNLDGDNVNTFTPDARIPWNPQWEASQGGDNEMIIVDDRFDTPTGGRVYYLSGYYPENPKFPYRKIPPIGCSAYWSANRLCTYRTSVARDLNGNYVDYRTYEGFVKDRGVGISFLATLVTPEEVKAEEIRHAVGIAIPNTSYGPECSANQKANWNQEGVTCGVAVAPATKFEWGSAIAPPVMKEPYKSLYTLEKTIPEGMRFALDMTYTQIDQWVNTRTDLSPTRKKTARIFARALKDYGMMVVDTNGNKVGIQQAGGINPDNAALWTELGMGPDEKDNLLDGLITATNLYVVNPPLATCKDGSVSRYYCEWTSIRYGN